MITDILMQHIVFMFGILTIIQIVQEFNLISVMEIVIVILITYIKRQDFYF